MSKKNENFLSIGELSKLTGVHIKSLRYYGEIGILTPAYIDPQNGYRYYTVSQIHIVEIIQLCIELDIPLKYFTKFMDINTGEINYDDLFDYGIRIANEKIKSINKRINNIQNIQNELDHSRRIKKAGEYICKRVTKSSINNAPAQFPKQFKTDNEKILIETELLPNSYNDDPIFELRCLLEPHTQK